MMEKIKIAFAALAVACLLMAVGFSAGWLAKEKHIQPIANDTIRIERIDTVTLVGQRDTLIRYVWKPYPVAVHDTTLIHHHTTDSIWISLPYEHRYMAKEDTLEVWYSGIDPKIDSAKVYMHQTTEIVKQPYEVARMPRLTLDVGAAAFYSDKSINPCLVGEMRYNAAKTTWSAYGLVNHEGKWGAGVGVTYRMNLIK
jgi:hypothetical protein